jgi:hypothetical protein
MQVFRRKIIVYLIASEDFADFESAGALSAARFFGEANI